MSYYNLTKKEQKYVDIISKINFPEFKVIDDEKGEVDFNMRNSKFKRFLVIGAARDEVFEVDLLGSAKSAFWSKYEYEHFANGKKIDVFDLFVDWWGKNEAVVAEWKKIVHKDKQGDYILLHIIQEFLDYTREDFMRNRNDKDLFYNWLKEKDESNG